jgi:hypothetical protein
VALSAIQTNFGSTVCPRLTRAERQANGSIHAVCENGETFRVFEIGGQVVAMRCAAAARYGSRAAECSWQSAPHGAACGPAAARTAAAQQPFCPVPG